MSDDGFHLVAEENLPAVVVVQGGQLGQERRASLNPAGEGLHGTFGTGIRAVEQGKFGLAVRVDLEHGFV